jgi:putative flippase GtrA
MKQFIKYLTVGVFNTILGYCVIFACMYLARMTPESSNIAGYIVGLFASYFLNRRYTFKSIQKRTGEIIRFVAVFLVSYAANFGILILLIHHLHIHEGVSQVLAGVVYVFSSFVLNKFFVFRAPGIT